MTMPTPQQIEFCEVSGWDYLGDGIFARGEQIGWFEGREFKKG